MLDIRRAVRAVVLVGLVLLVARAAGADEVRVVTSGAFTAACVRLVPEFERTTGHKVVLTFGASMGNGPDTIPSRLARGERVDVVILAASALDDLIKAGRVTTGSRVDLVRSRIGVAVRAGAPRPDIGTVDGLKRTLLHARSIGYSSSASGVYLTTELFPRLGIAGEITDRLRQSTGAVGELIARGEVEIGFQQISELLSVAGIDYVGPLPADVQRETVFSAGLAAGAPSPDAARALVAFFTSPAAAPIITATGLEPMTRAVTR